VFAINRYRQWTRHGRNALIAFSRPHWGWRHYYCARTWNQGGRRTYSDRRRCLRHSWGSASYCVSRSGESDGHGPKHHRDTNG
jgi:hypothetical protein